MKVSIVIPTYNAGHKLIRALMSVVSQTAWLNGHTYEVLICDDGSTDLTLDIARQFLYVRILASEKNTGGPNAGRNRGIQAATGDVIAFLDQDDEWLPDKITHQLELLERTGNELAYSTFIQEGTRDDIIFNSNIYECLLNYSFPNGGIYLGSILVKNRNIPLFKTKWLDFDWLLDLTGCRTCVQTVPMVRRNVDGNNLSLNPAYRQADYDLKVGTIKNKKSIKKINGSYARYFYKMQDYQAARHYFCRSDWSMKNIMYIITSFCPPVARWVVRKFTVFG